LKVVNRHKIFEKLIALETFVHAQLLVVFRIVKLVPLILLSHWKTASLLILAFIVKISLLIRKSLKTLGTSLMVWLLLSEDTTDMASYDIAVRWLVRAVVNQLQVRYFDIHLSYNFPNRSPKFAVNFEGLLLFLVV